MTERTLSLAGSKNLAQNLGFLGWARVFGVVALVGTMLSLPLTNIFALLALLFWVCSGCKPGQNWRADLKTPAVFGALLLLGWMLLSLLWSHAPLQQTFIGIWKYRKLVYVPLMVFLFADAKWRDAAIKAWLEAGICQVMSVLQLNHCWSLLRWGVFLIQPCLTVRPDISFVLGWASCLRAINLWSLLKQKQFISNYG